MFSKGKHYRENVLQYLDTNLNYQQTGSVVVVHLQGSEANVQLLDNSTFERYRRRQAYTGSGGHYRRSPVQLVIPHDGYWHAVVDLGGYAGSVRASVEVFPAAA